ncbi:cytochrome c maturation protein CcmE [Effusibacillus lacus]|uniref:Cytochrome c maturation protein CcmE n=1 Tax=Effusibacillus lacus TaxID=1348429 RepID=A0A292YSH1_9BACL|nr:cytochrome c maturation protein CcmE [Effusibacillus lacus]TCS76115.1 cytochrome c-type biogenesis protein CcmE [Effusibacillus lacus]GAX91374.1 hypothetical protein EFBL_3043 [Effusibacillus lacus]
MKKNAKVLMGSLVIVISVIFLLFWATPGSTGMEVTIGDVVKNPNKFQNEFLSLQGNLVEESVKWNADKVELRFTIEDENKDPLAVVYQGVKPDTFSEGTIVIVEGQYDAASKTFVAERVKTRCPSKYEGQEYDPKLHEDLKKNKDNKQ